MQPFAITEENSFCCSVDIVDWPEGSEVPAFCLVESDFRPKVPSRDRRLVSDDCDIRGLEDVVDEQRDKLLVELTWFDIVKS